MKCVAKVMQTDVSLAFMLADGSGRMAAFKVALPSLLQVVDHYTAETVAASLKKVGFAWDGRAFEIPIRRWLDTVQRRIWFGPPHSKSLECMCACGHSILRCRFGYCRHAL